MNNKKYGRRIIVTQVIMGALEYAAEEMGIVLRNAAYSANIKERMDHSCAIFDAQGRMLAQAEHIPVHLGAMPLAVKTVLKDFENEIERGDMIILNDPYKGGTHLPDITLISPIFYGGEIVGFSVSRAHHSDVGGKSPGSMPGDATEIFQEGFIIPPVKIIRRGKIDKDMLKLILSNVRTPNIRMGDLYAQMAANKIGEKRVVELIERYELQTFLEIIDDILGYSERRMRTEISKMPSGVYEAEDYMDDDGISDKSIRIHVKVEVRKNSVRFDFSGTDPQVDGPINCPFPVTLSCSYYVLRSITDPTIPANEGTYRPLSVYAPEGCLLNAKFPAAVAGGNVETSQRVVDVLLKAFASIVPDRVPAACQGTMNNICIGGIDPKTRDPFSFYETIGGGYGGRKGLDGLDGIHSHMTNTMNTPIEEIEARYPIMILKYGLREDSGGAGQWRGGLGIERIYKILCEATLSTLGERHKTGPWGLFGGKPGKPGEYLVIKENGRKAKLRSKCLFKLDKGDIIIIRTPGGGGYGNPQKRNNVKIKEDLLDGKVTIEMVEKEYHIKIS